MHTNRLANEKSPYLLQHSHNPVDWYPWGAEAFEKARGENKPIFLSVGYSTCHWCHVMERESFEDEPTAALLNRDFVAIKVDREERPDVDRMYMAFVQAYTGGGGWPMSVWLTPELEPFFGGTYFPPESQYGRPGFGTVLTQIAAAWAADPARIAESARAIVEQLRRGVAVERGTPGAAPIGAELLNAGFNVFRRTFDSRRGGFGDAPKFPRPSVLNFLLRRYAGSQNGEALEMALLTLREMAKGGINDHLGGGFHRYSVDNRWFVPHFEKMLYDQAQLAVSYLEAFQIAGDASFAGTARRTLDYTLGEMCGESGFYSAEDADSAISPERPHEKGEGAFYIWTAREIDDLAGATAGEWLRFRYGVEDGGNVAHDPHGEFTGKNILYQAHSLEETALQFGRGLEEVRAGLAEAERILLAARSRRPRPHRDDKILTAWNGLMISACALGGAILEEPRYAEAARDAAGFVLSRLYDPASGLLLRRYRAGEAAVPGFLADYAFFVQGLLDLYEAQFDIRHLETAIRLTEKQLELFEDREHGGFFDAAEDPALLLRVKEDHDGAEPSGNSVAVMNLLRLARMANRSDFRAAAERTLAAFDSRLAAAPAALPHMLAACEFLLGDPREVVLVGARGGADTAALRRALFTRFAPCRVALLVDSPETRAKLAANNPALASMTMVQGRASAYVCRNYACQAPVFEPEKLAELIQ
ncbi:MAG: thioredoxin domain-containing protein [Bryobacteraceae bacterium]|jgi:uncharacterized protein YyaL (SSP411 family)